MSDGIYCEQGTNLRIPNALSGVKFCTGHIVARSFYPAFGQHPDNPGSVDSDIDFRIVFKALE